MSWVVRNKLRGTLELHGFLPNGQPVRIPGEGSFDLDSLPVKRDVLENSRQVQVAFKEGYLVTELRNDEMVEAPSSPTNLSASGISRWQTNIQGQLNSQARRLEDLSEAVHTLIEKVSTLGIPQPGTGNMSLDAEALKGILKDESKKQVTLLKRALKEDGQEENYLTEVEATNRARLIENQIHDMSVEFDVKQSSKVEKVDSTGNNSEKVDLLSHLGGLDE